MDNNLNLQEYNAYKLQNKIFNCRYTFGDLSHNGKSTEEVDCKYSIDGYGILTEDDVYDKSSGCELKIKYKGYKYVKYLTQGFLIASNNYFEYDILYLSGELFKGSVRDIDYGDNYICYRFKHNYIDEGLICYLYNTQTKLWCSMVPPLMETTHCSIENIKLIHNTRKTDIYEISCYFFDAYYCCDSEGNDAELVIDNEYKAKGVISSSNVWLINPSRNYIKFIYRNNLILSQTLEGPNEAFKIVHYRDNVNIVKLCDYQRLESFSQIIVFQLENSQALYDTTKKLFSGYIFDRSIKLLPEFYGENLIGIEFFQNDSSKKYRSIKKHGFIDLKGNIIITLERFWFIYRGFKEGKALIYRETWSIRTYQIIDVKGNVLEEKKEHIGYEHYSNYEDIEKDNFYGLTDGMWGDYPYD